MVNPFWHNPDFAIKQIREVADDWRHRSKELTYVDKKGYTQHDDDYNSEQNDAFQTIKHIILCVYDDKDCK
jgi:hypothetical protein